MPYISMVLHPLRKALRPRPRTRNWGSEAPEAGTNELKGCEKLLTPSNMKTYGGRGKP